MIHRFVPLLESFNAFDIIGAFGLDNLAYAAERDEGFYKKEGW